MGKTDLEAGCESQQVVVAGSSSRLDRWTGGGIG